MRKLIVFLSIMIFMACSQDKEEKSNNIQKNDTLITISSIDRVFTDYKKAFLVAKKEKKPLFILFTTEHCRWCKKLKEITLKNSEIIKRLNSEFIVLELDKYYSDYPKKYDVSAVPTLYLTNNSGEIFTSIVGYHKNPNDYIKWFDYIKVELAK